MFVFFWLYFGLWCMGVWVVVVFGWIGCVGWLFSVGV